MRVSAAGARRAHLGLSARDHLVRRYTKPADSYNLAVNNVTRHLSHLVALLRKRAREAPGELPWAMVVNADHGASGAD